MKSALSISTMALGAMIAATNVSAQSWTNAYTSPTATGNCEALPAALNTGFTSTPIVSQALFPEVLPYRVIKMAFWLKPGAQFNDIYIAEKGTGGNASTAGTARVLHYDGVTSSLRVIGTLTGVNHGGGGVAEQGLLGIALNPVTFGEDRYIYVSYNVGYSSSQTLPTPQDSVGLRVSRFQLDAQTGMMDMASEKVIFHVPMAANARWHTGGALQIDNYGHLYISTGDNEALAMGAGNTADLRGAILRIKLDNSAQGYSIPAGNFGDYWAQKWQDSGLTARATEYRDPTKVRPEIYVKGTRNAYTISLDRHRAGWLQWSECGPDQQRAEEHSFTTKPAFSGWPFWAGNGVRQSSKAGSYNEENEPSSQQWAAFNPDGMSTQVPVNNWEQNPGVDTLPPMHAPTYSYTSPSCAAGGGPVVRYDGSVSNPNKMPPHLDNVLFFSDYMGSTIWARPLDPTTGTPKDTVTTVFTMAKTGRPNLNSPVDFQQGADGSLYMVDWGRANDCCTANPTPASNGIVRITYTGTCSDPGLVTSLMSERRVSGYEAAAWLRVGTTTFSITAPGLHEATVVDLSGRMVHSFRGEGHKTYNLPKLGSGIHVLRVKTSQGIVSRPLSAGL